jgi:hypothetical protein
MKREGGGEGFRVMKKGHEEKSMSPASCCDLKYAKYGMDNPKELKESTDALASYVKKNKMKY